MFKLLKFSIATLVWTAVVAGCGGGGGSNSPPPPVTPPSALTYPAVGPLTVGTAMTNASPTVTGTVTGYQVAPALPAGLTLNATSGLISGTPTAITVTTSHTVTASNAGGNTTIAVAITVNDAAPTVTYGAARSLVVGNPVTLTPTRTGGAVITWNVAPALPAGLTLGNDGGITGSPTTAGAAANYTITAVNTGGQSQATLNLGVESGVLLDLGHSYDVVSVLKSGSRVLSYDSTGVWKLWNYATGEEVAAGDVVCLVSCFGLSDGVDLANDLVVIDMGNALELRAAVNGSLTASIPLPVRPAWWKLATDASYVVTGSQTALTVWSRNGTVLLTRAGDFSYLGISRERVFAAPGELRLATPAFVNQSTIVETIAVPSGTPAQTEAFTGAFRAWFKDGTRLLAGTGNTVYVYSRTGGAALDTATLPGFLDNLGGTGDWYWTRNNHQILIYAVGSGGTATVTHSYIAPTVFASTTTLGVADKVPNTFRIYDLTAGTPTSTSYNLTLRREVWSYGRGTGSEWVLGTRDGLVVDGSSLASTPRLFNVGSVRAIAAGTQFTSVATASGRIFVFDSATKASVGTIALDALDIKSSADGVTLAVLPWTEGPYVTDAGIRIFTLPGTTPVHTWPGTVGVDPAPFAIEISASGHSLLRGLFTESTSKWEQNAPTGGPSLGSFPGGEARESPNASRVAATYAYRPLRNYNPPTNLYTNGVLTGAVQPATPVVWLDDTRILMAKYRTRSPAGGSYVFDGMAIYSDTGMNLATAAMPEILRAQVVDANSIYSPEFNVILATATGDTLWSSPRRILGVGAVAGPRVVFVSRAEVRAEPR